MQMKQAILKTTQKVIVLADSSRFGGGYFSVICPISSVFRIVTDSGVSYAIVRRTALRGDPLVMACPSRYFLLYLYHIRLFSVHISGF